VYGRTIAPFDALAAISGKNKDPDREPRPRRRATYKRNDGVRYLRSLYPPDVRIAIVCDNYSPHLSTRVDQRVGDWAAATSVEVAYTPTNSSCSTASKPSSPRCATSPWTAPTTAATSKAA
jgi:hypothetical protein